MLYLKFPLILLLTIVSKFVEQGRNIVANSKGNSYKVDVKIMYKALYLHLPMSMTSVGLYWNVTKLPSIPLETMTSLIIVFIFTILGCFLRGIISKSSPEAMTLTDPDWCFGVLIPNTLGVISLCIAIAFNS